MRNTERIERLTYLYQKMAIGFNVLYDELLKRGASEDEMAELIEKINYEYAKEHPDSYEAELYVQN